MAEAENRMNEQPGTEPEEIMDETAEEITDETAEETIDETGTEEAAAETPDPDGLEVQSSSEENIENALAEDVGAGSREQSEEAEETELDPI